MLLYGHDDFLEHDTGDGHPEHAGRLATVMAAMAACGDKIQRVDAPLGTHEQILLAHPRRHLEAVLQTIPAAGRAGIDADTIVSPHSGAAALRAVGAVCDAVERICNATEEDARRAFAAVRPPGHHAEANRAMGFCLFNSVAVGAEWALHEGYVDRVAVLDFDVHHGNGTQDIFWQDERVRFASSHQFPLYPGTGSADERGAMGNILNAPLVPGSGSAAFRDAWRAILDAIDRFEPQLLIVSAGFDAHRLDPLADLNLETEDFGWIAEQLGALANAHAGGRIVSALEGGYSLTALRESVPAYVMTLAD